MQAETVTVGIIERKVLKMATAIENKFRWNEDRMRWERVDRVQEYRGHKIETVTWHYDDCKYWETHRDYRITKPSGKVICWGINKRGGNIKALKEYIDFNIENDSAEYL